MRAAIHVRRSATPASATLRGRRAGASAPAHSRRRRTATSSLSTDIFDRRRLPDAALRRPTDRGPARSTSTCRTADGRAQSVVDDQRAARTSPSESTATSQHEQPAAVEDGKIVLPFTHAARHVRSAASSGPPTAASGSASIAAPRTGAPTPTTAQTQTDGAAPPDVPASSRSPPACRRGCVTPRGRLHEPARRSGSGCAPGAAHERAVADRVDDGHGQRQARCARCAAARRSTCATCRRAASRVVDPAAAGATAAAVRDVRRYRDVHAEDRARARPAADAGPPRQAR